MKPDGVTIVDQIGRRCSPSPAGAAATAADERIEFQRRVEDKYRTQLIQLLTPLVGAGNFTAEVQADVDLDETQATRESYDKQGALRAETGQLDRQPEDGAGAPGGIPGALPTRRRRASTLQQPQAAQRRRRPARPVAGGPAARSGEAVRQLPARLRSRQGSVGHPRRAGRGQAPVGRGAAARSRQGPAHRDGDRSRSPTS